MRGAIPMTVINARNGQPIMNIGYQGNLGDIEFLEQFNEKLLIKNKNRSLKIMNTVSNQSVYVEQFGTPEAFIFVYEKEMFICLK